jgi:hypothetical protein
MSIILEGSGSTITRVMQQSSQSFTHDTSFGRNCRLFTKKLQFRKKPQVHTKGVGNSMDFVVHGPIVLDFFYFYFVKNCITDFSVEGAWTETVDPAQLVLAESLNRRFHRATLRIAVPLMWLSLSLQISLT